MKDWMNFALRYMNQLPINMFITHMLFVQGFEHGNAR